MFMTGEMNSELIIEKINNLQRTMDLRFGNIQMALELREKINEERFKGLTDGSSQIKEIQSKYLPKEEYLEGHKDLSVKIETLQKIMYVGIGGVGIINLLLRFWH